MFVFFFSPLQVNIRLAVEEDNNKENSDGDDDSEEDEDSDGELLRRSAHLQLQPLNDTGKTQRQGILKVASPTNKTTNN